MEEFNEVGKRIRKIRKDKGLTMEEFGKLFDPIASKGVVSNWENNYNLPNNERLKRIAELGEITLNELLYGRIDEIEFDRESVNNTLDIIYRLSDLAQETTENVSRIINSEFADEKTMLNSFKSLEEVLSETLPRIAQASQVAKTQLNFKETDEKYRDLLSQIDKMVDELDNKIVSNKDDE